MKLPNLTPTWCEWTPENPRPFTIWLNILYASAGGFTSATMYYSHPILNVLAQNFHTTQAGVANIPTLALAGSAAGLILLLPLADFFPRRNFTLALMIVAIAFWLGLCITNDLNLFLVLTFLSAIFSGVTQIMLPLVAELSTDENRAVNISIVATGPTLGILLARILSGIVANYTHWRNVYWLGLGLQVIVLVLLYFFMPNYPATNPATLGKIALRYPRILWSIVMLYPSHPILVQASLLAMLTFFTVSSYWTTLTFLLSSSPYQYNTFTIGLFGLIGASTMVLGPIYGRYIVQPLKTPLLSAAVGVTVSLLGIIIGTFVGERNVAGPVIQALFLDAGLMILQVSNRVAIHGVEPQNQNRVNTAFVMALMLGSLAGTKAGNQVFESGGGWVASGYLSIGIIACSYIIIGLRGPYETRWIGWHGGWKPIKSKDQQDGPKDTAGTSKIEAEISKTAATFELLESQKTPS